VPNLPSYPAKAGYPVPRGASVQFTVVSGILDHPPSRVMTAVRVSRSSSVAALEAADVLLRIELEPDAPDQIELGFEEVDVMFLVLHQLFEQVA
jgi:hypothetical protein